MKTTAARPKALIALLAAAGLALPSAARADAVLVAVAANFAGPLAKLAEGLVQRSLRNWPRYPVSNAMLSS